MSRWTTELRYPLTMGKDIGLKNYPIYDENYRAILNGKIIEHFWFREIGYETFERFKMALNIKMNEIMPFYNVLYQNTIDDFMINKDIKITENNDYASARKELENNKIKSVNHDIGSAHSEDESNYKKKQSDTPMGKLNNIYSDDYATSTEGGDNNTSVISNSENWTDTDSDTQNKADISANANEDKFMRRYGLEGDMIKGDIYLRFKDTLLNIDMMIIKDLETLFFGLW